MSIRFIRTSIITAKTSAAVHDPDIMIIIAFADTYQEKRIML